MHSPIEIYNLITEELSKLKNDNINNLIVSYENFIQDMSTEEFHETAEELIWTAEELLEANNLLEDEDDTGFDFSFLEETIELCKNNLTKLFEMI